MTWYGALLGAAGSGEKDDDGGSVDTGLVGNTLGIGAGLEARDKNRDRAASKEARRQARQDAMFNYEEAKRGQERSQDLAPEMMSHLQTDYLTPSMMGPTDRDQIGGGAMETILGLAGGYNPAIAANPYMNVLQGDVAAQDSMRKSAQDMTERTLSGWEDQQARVMDDYTRTAEDLGAERDRMTDLYTDALSEDREAGQEDMAKRIVDAWVQSNDKKGALGRSVFEEKRRSHRGKYGTGKTVGASEKRKQEYIDSLLSSGMTYEQLLNDPNFVAYLAADENASTLLGAYDGPLADPASRSDAHQFAYNANDYFEADRGIGNMDDYWRMVEEEEARKRGGA